MCAFALNSRQIDLKVLSIADSYEFCSLDIIRNYCYVSLEYPWEWKIVS